MDYGYGIYRIHGGREIRKAHFAVADPLDDAEGSYLECKTMAEAKAELERLNANPMELTIS